MAAAAQAIAITRALTDVMRNGRGRLISALIARLCNFRLAEVALQEAATSAMIHWGRLGLPDNPQGWLLKVALREAKIAAAGSPFVIPGPEDIADRLNSVLVVIYLIFNAGYTAGAAISRDLYHEAIYLARMVNAIALNRAVAMAETGQLDAALAQRGALAEALNDYQPFHAANADLLARAGRQPESYAAFGRAIDLAASSSDAAFLINRRAKLLN